MEPKLSAVLKIVELIVRIDRRHSAWGNRPSVDRGGGIFTHSGSFLGQPHGGPLVGKQPVPDHSCFGIFRAS